MDTGTTGIKVYKADSDSDNKFEAHPPGLFKAMVEGIKFNEPNEYGESLTITYSTDKEVAVNPDGSSVMGLVWDMVGLKKNPEGNYIISAESKLGQRIVDIMGLGSFDNVPAEFKLDNLVGQICSIVVSHAKSKKGSTYAKVTQVIPFDGSPPPTATVNVDNTTPQQPVQPPQQQQPQQPQQPQEQSPVPF